MKKDVKPSYKKYITVPQVLDGSDRQVRAKNINEAVNIFMDRLREHYDKCGRYGFTYKVVELEIGPIILQYRVPFTSTSHTIAFEIRESG